MHKKIPHPAWLPAALPFLRWWPMVDRHTTRADLLAGLTGAIVVLPQGVAFAALAGLPPQYGLYAAMVPAVVAALFGSSWHLISGPTNAISFFLFAVLSHLAEPGGAEYIRLALTLTFLVGVIQLAMGIARLGTLVNFISHTVVVGFTAGAGVLILVAQLKNFFGVPIPRGLPFIEIVHHFIRDLADINPYVSAVGVATLAAGILFRRFYPRAPYMIVAMIVGSLVALVLDAVFGRDVTHIATVGALPSPIPPFSMPDLSADAIRKTASPAFAVTILALTEAVSIARSVGVKSGQRIDGNQEFIGQGLSNMFGSFFSAYAASGSFNRSGVNYEAGARTPLAAIFSAVFLVLTLLLVAPLAAYLPVPAMAAVLFIVAWGLIDVKHFRAIVAASRGEAAVLLVTFAATLFAHLDTAIYAGVILSLMLYLNRTSRPRVVDLKPDPEPGGYHFSPHPHIPDCPQFKMLRINGSLFFGAVDHVQGELQAIDEREPRQRHVMIGGSGINFVDVAGAEMLAQEARRRRAMGGGLYFYRLKEEAREMLQRSGALREIGEENLFPVRTPVVARIYPQLDQEICRQCTRRIFAECRERLPDGTPRAQSPADAQQQASIGR